MLNNKIKVFSLSLIFLSVFTLKVAAENQWQNSLVHKSLISQVNPKNIPTNQDLQLFVTGKVFTQEKIGFPKNSVIEIKLVDISRQDAPARLISQQQINVQGQTNYLEFKLPYSAEKIDNRYTYAVQVKVFVNNQLTYITDKIYSVITRNKPTNIDVPVTKINNSASETSPLISEWLLEFATGGGLLDRVQTTLELTKDGKIFGNGGCNHYQGSYEIKDHKINISPLISTRKICPPAVMNQETNFLQILETAETFSLDGDFLWIYTTNQEKSLKFTPIRK